MIWSKEPDLPGPKKLIGGNANAGFFGEVSTSDFITGYELARSIGLTAGVSQCSNEPWLKFSYIGKIEYIAKKPFRAGLSWNDINAVNAVFGNRFVEIRGHIYKIRLMKGKTEGMQNDENSSRGLICYNSEWNRLMLPIHEDAPSNWKYLDNVQSPTEKWGNGYTDDDLFTNSSQNRDKGNICWCQENGKNMETKIGRGSNYVTYSDWYVKNGDTLNFGWRPVLEFVK